MVDILVIGARGIPDAEGGAEKNAEAVLPLLVGRGYDVEFLGIRGILKAPSYRGVKLTALPTLRLGNTDKLIYHVLAFAYAALTRPRLVHLQGLNSAILLALYKLCGLKVVLRYGSADHEYAKWGLVGRLGFKLCERQVRFADHIITVSQKYKRDLQSRYGLQRVQCIPNGVDSAEVSAEASAHWSTLDLEHRRYVLAVGRITADKCYESLIEAFERLGDPGLRLVIAGGVSEEDYYRRLKSMSSDRVRFLGRVDRRLLSALYAHSAVYVNCSLHEGLSNAVLEAISHDCPLIVSDIPANVEMGLAKSSYFNAGDPRSLGALLGAALAEPEKYVPAAGLYPDWPTVAARTEGVYRAVHPAFASRAEPSRRPAHPISMGTAVVPPPMSTDRPA